MFLSKRITLIFNFVFDMIIIWGLLGCGIVSLYVGLWPVSIFWFVLLYSYGTYLRGSYKKV